MQYTEDQLSKLIADVEKEFTAHLAKAEEDFKSSTLAKSEGVESAASGEPLAKAEEKKEEEKKEEPKAKEEPKEDEKGEPKQEKEAEAKEGEHIPEGGKPEGEKPAEEAAAPAEGDDSCDYDEEDHKHMHDLYMSMSKGELKAHHDACRKALDHKGMAKCGDMSMSKSEENKTVDATTIVVPATQPSPEVELLKSEVEAQKAKAEGLQKSLDAVSSFLTKLVEKKVAPQGKAITSLDVIAKSENVQEEKQLTKSEIDAKLLSKSQDPKLEKSDRDLINAFYLTGASINSISHLLK